MNTKTIRILIADKNQDSRFALALLLDTRLGATVVGEAPTMEALLEQAAATHPDVVLLDWELPGRPEADRIVVLRSVVPEAQIIVISTRPESESQASDADGFVNKAAPPNTSWLL
jgi:two-component system response regulator DesR